MIMTIIATWSRVIGIYYVVEKYAKLLITTQKMLISAKTFFIILLLYFIIMGVIAMALFQEYSVTYSTPMNTLRTMFDVMMGAFSYELGDPKKFKYMHTFYMYFHVYIANIFMLNYLVAILATVYEEMLEQGDFIYKCKKYFYIERYMIAFKDDWGYTELIVHAPPVNFFLIFLIPAIFNREKMKRWALNYSITVFWAENVFFIFDMLVRELCLVPYNYLRVSFFVLKLASLEDIYLFFFWVICGIPYLLFYGVTTDMYYYIKILQDY